MEDIPQARWQIHSPFPFEAASQVIFLSHLDFEVFLRSYDYYRLQRVRLAFANVLGVSAVCKIPSQEADTAAHVLFSGAEYSKPGSKYRK